MTMTQNDKNGDDIVESMLAEAERKRGHPSRALTARVLAQALAVQPAPATLAPFNWRRWVDGLGGWQAIGGLAAACCVGFWIGLSPPEGVVDAGALLLGAESVPYDEAAEISAFGWDPQEG